MPEAVTLPMGVVPHTLSVRFTAAPLPRHLALMLPASGNGLSGLSAWVATADLLRGAVPCYGFTPIERHGSSSWSRRIHSVSTWGFQVGFTVL